MNNDWIQVNYSGGDVELFNTDDLIYMLKNTTANIRKLAFKSDRDSIILDPADTVQSKTQQEVETFLGGALIKMELSDAIMYLPVKNLVSIKKVGPTITIKMSVYFAEADGVITKLSDAEFANEFG